MIFFKNQTTIGIEISNVTWLWHHHSNVIQGGEFLYGETCVSFNELLTMPKKQKRPIIPINQHTEDHSLVSTYTFVTKQNNERWMTTVCQRGGHQYIAFIVSILLQIVSYISIIILKTLIYILIRCKTLRHKMTI